MEKPILWTNLNLMFNVYKEGRGSEQWEGRVDRDDRVAGASVGIVDGVEVGDSVHICGWTEELVKVLTMPRLRSLEHLTLDFFFMSQIFWQECLYFLQVVSDFAPSVKRVSWRERGITVTSNPTPVDELAQQLVAKLAKFEEVHFSSPFYEDNFGNLMIPAILRALAAASSGEDSKLKVLTLDGEDSDYSAELGEARKKLSVNIVSSVLDLAEGLGGEDSE